MDEKLTTYDPAEDLNNDAAIAIFMAEALETGDAEYIAHALDVSLRAKDNLEHETRHLNKDKRDEPK